MTETVEVKFFNTFNIKPVEITNDILMGLINIIIHKKLEFACSYSTLHNTYSASKDDNYEDGYLSCREYSLKDSILSLCINIKDDIEVEVKKLLKGLEK